MMYFLSKLGLKRKRKELPSLFSLFKFFLYLNFKKKSTYFYPLTAFIFYLLNTIVIHFFVDLDNPNGFDPNWNVIFASSISLASTISVLFGTRVMLNIFSERENEYDLILCSKPFTREGVVIIKILTILFFSVYISLSSFFSSFLAFTVDPSKTDTKSIFFFYTFFLPFFSSLFFSSMTGFLFPILSPTSSRVCVIVFRFVFSILGGLVPIISPLITYSSQKASEKRELFPSPTILSFFHKKESSDLKNFYFFNNPANNNSLQDQKEGGIALKSNPNNLSFSKPQLDFFKKVFNDDKWLSIFVKILQWINIPYQISNSGEYGKGIAIPNTSRFYYFAKEVPFSGLEAFNNMYNSLSFSLETGDNSDRYEDWPFKMNNQGKSFFVVPALFKNTLSIDSTFGNFNEEEDLSPVLYNAENRGELNYFSFRPKTSLSSIGKIEDKFAGKSEFYSIPVYSSYPGAKKGSDDKKLELLGYIDINWIIYALYDEDLSRVIKDFVVENSGHNLPKTKTVFRRRLLNAISANFGSDNLVKTLTLLIASYYLIYLTDTYPIALRRLVLEADYDDKGKTSLPIMLSDRVTLKAKDYIIGDNDLSKNSTPLFITADNFLHYRVNFRVIPAYFLFFYWTLLSLLFFLLLFLMYRRKDYK